MLFGINSCELQMSEFWPSLTYLFSYFWIQSNGCKPGEVGTWGCPWVFCFTCGQSCNWTSWKIRYDAPSEMLLFSIFCYLCEFLVRICFWKILIETQKRYSVSALFFSSFRRYEWLANFSNKISCIIILKRNW